MAETDAKLLAVEVAYARPEQQLIKSLQVAPGTTLLQAIIQADIAAQFSDIDLANVKAGIFGKVQPLDSVLQNGDRVEIYRALKIDPKQQRKLRAAKKHKY